MLHLILGRDWKANRDEILNRISSDVANHLSGRILIVPEFISHETERRLCLSAGDSSSLYAEVLSFSRLADRVAQSAGSAAIECLDNGGRLVAMAAAANQLHSRLKAYASVESRPEFLNNVVDAVDEFKRCCISSHDLMLASKNTSGSLAQKLEELALLMETYDSICSRGKRDPRDLIMWCLEQMEAGDFAQKHVFYVDGFPDFTRQHMAVLEHLILQSPQVTISFNCDKLDSRSMAFEKASNTAMHILNFAKSSGIKYVIEYVEEEDRQLSDVRNLLFQGTIEEGIAGDVLSVFRADCVYHECMGAAGEIQELVQRGYRYRDITLVCTEKEEYLPDLQLIFHRMNIPLYQSGTENILQKSVISTVLTAIDAVLSDMDQRKVLRYARSALSPLDFDICDEIENYAVTWGIRGNKWFQPWQNHPDGISGKWDEISQEQIERIENARQIAVSPLIHMKQGFYGARNIRDQILAVYRFFEEIDLADHLSDMAVYYDDAGDNRSAQVLNQLWEILIGALEQMYDVLGESVFDPDHFYQLFKLLLTQYDVGTIPPVLDAVQVGSISAMRCHQEKHLIVLGAQEGSFPRYSTSSGILTDYERSELRQIGVPLTGGSIEGIQEEFAEIYGAFCGATQSVSVYCQGEQPSFIYKRLSLLAGQEKPANQHLVLAKADPFEASAHLKQINDIASASNLNLMSHYKDIEEKLGFSLGKLSRDQVESLYGKSLALSASQIDSQAECRLNYFLKYGLRLRERKEVSVDPTEFGTYVHAVLENTTSEIRDKGGFHAVSLEETMDLARKYAQKYSSEHFSQINSERIKYLLHRNDLELEMVVQELWEELQDSAFEPQGFEVDFGGEGGLPPIEIPNDAMKAYIRGFVDRMDTWRKDENVFFRIVDYKTGKMDFDYCNVFFGVGLQMLIYMFALRNSGEDHLIGNPVPAGVLYFPARAPFISADGAISDDQAEVLRQTEWKRQGLLLRDETVLGAMEHSLPPKRLNYSFNKQAELSGDLADRSQFEMLESYVFGILGDMVCDIASGNIEANPYTRGTKHNACSFCPYGEICHKDYVEGRRNYKAMTAARFWEEVEKKVKEHG